MRKDRIKNNISVIILMILLIALQWYAQGISLEDLKAFNSDVIVAVFVSLLFVILGLLEIERRSKLKKKKPGIIQHEEQFIDVLIKYASIVIQSDGKRDYNEFKYVEDYFNQFYEEKKTKGLIERLVRELSVKEETNQLSKYTLEYLNADERLHLVYVLCGITASDNFISTVEYEKLKEIVSAIDITINQLEAHLATFNCKKQWVEEAEEYYRQQNQGSFDYNKGPRFSLETCYTILGLSAGATKKEIKKAYRKLVFKHHPDRLVHLGEEQSKIAQKKLLEIIEAYEILKKNLGFN